ncbi:MAG TPA: GlsB/YeaQ/YmgE family stress response membrane protein [Pseudolabrys sp.]|nr:GlsB/YeaQ/YmgE family stress response membrane protein [Pseudolabrys sp.]
MSMEHNKTLLSLSAKRSGAQQKRLGIHIASGIVSAIIVATIGAVVLLIIARLATRAYPRRRSWRL